MNKSDVLFKVSYYAKQLKDDVKIYFYVPDFDNKKFHFIAELDANDAIRVPYYVRDYWFDEKNFNVVLDDFILKEINE